MKESLLISSVLILFFIFILYGRNGVTLVELGNREYLVQNNDLKYESAEILSQIEKNLYMLRDYLLKNKKLYPEFEEYITLLGKNLDKKRTKIYEGAENSEYTSYSVNKGEEIVFCLKSKITKQIHDLNLLMYVALHEVSHLACPEIDHTPLFKKIFAFITKIAIKLGIFKYVNFEKNPVEYCGMTLSSTIIQQ